MSGTLEFARALWLEGARYTDTSLAENAALIRRAFEMGKRLLRLDHQDEYIYVRHPRNTWRFDTGSFLDPHGWYRGSGPVDFSPVLLQSYRTASHLCGGAAQGLMRTGPTEASEPLARLWLPAIERWAGSPSVQAALNP